jgi:hypothetical protein
MRTSAGVLIVVCALLLITPLVRADTLEKAYFAATPPGAWAKYESNWEMPNGMSGINVYSYIRAPDHDGRVRVEMSTETLSGPGEGTTTRQLFVMEPGFDLARNFMNRMSHLEASVAQTGDGPPILMQDNVMEIMRTASGDLTNSVAFQGTTTIGGHECDHYRYSYSSGGPHVTHQEGEICLDETLPFGLVYQKGRSTDEAGELISSYEQQLVESGTGQSATPDLLAVSLTPAAPAVEIAAPDAPVAVPIEEAYKSGELRLFVEVVEGSGGRRLDITAQNQTDEPLVLVVAEGPLTISVGFPIGDLELYFNEEQRFSVAPGGSSPTWSAGQPGDRGAVGGSFQLTMHDGQTLYQGSIDVGPLE